jgi:hypothetical protein
MNDEILAMVSLFIITLGGKILLLWLHKWKVVICLVARVIYYPCATGDFLYAADVSYVHGSNNDMMQSS